MAIRDFLYIISITVGVSTAFLAFLPNTNLWAANIQCTVNPCIGTMDSDYLKGDRYSNQISASYGDDTVQGFESDDEICGGSGNDKIEGGEGNDIILAESSFTKKFCEQEIKFFGAESIYGGGGNDLIYSGREDRPTDSDGFKDYIDCGPGYDTVYLDPYVDRDVAVNCENYR